MGQLILKSIPPYELGYNMKLPGTYYMYALIMWIFGETVTGIHTGLLLCDVATMILIVAVFRRLTSTTTALAASLLFGWMAASSSVLGFAAHATHFVILMAMVGTYILQRAMEKNNFLLYAVSGFFFTLATIMKQHGLFFIIMGFTIIIFCSSTKSKAAIAKAGLSFCGGVICMVSILFFTMYTSGVFSKFWFWTVTYALDYEGQVWLRSVPGVFLSAMRYVAKSFFLVWIFGFIGFVSLLFLRKQYLIPEHKLFVILFSVFSCLTVAPGFYFRAHYFVTFLPAVSLLAGIGVNFISQRFQRFSSGKVLWVAILLSIFVALVIEREYFFLEKSVALSHSIYPRMHSFPETQKIGEFIRSETNRDDKVFVFGSEPQIYFYSNRISATGYLYMYPFLENHANSIKMQQEMIAEVESTVPEILVDVHTIGSWKKEPTLPDLYTWFENYATSNYEVIQVIDIISDEQQISKSGTAARKYLPTSPSFIRVFKRIRN
jgi:hypothetical protein